jgi:RNA polymerase sigma factor (sigma-70 family)
MQGNKHAQTPLACARPGEEIVSGKPRKEEVEARRKQLEEDYERVWKNFGASLARLTSSYESNAHAREDLLQEIRLALWVALPRFRHDCSLRTFVLRVAHNRALTHVWKRKKPSPSVDLEGVEDARDNPEVSAIRNANRSRLEEMIRHLPIPFRQVITLVLEDLPYSEIAAVLGISESNVAVRLTRARKLLREKLGVSYE